MKNSGIALILFFLAVIFGGLYLVAWMSVVLHPLVPKL